MDQLNNRLLFKKTQIILFASIISIILIIAGYIYYLTEKKRISNDNYIDLNTISELKIKQILQWKNERIEDAGVISRNPLLTETLEKYKQNNSTILKLQLNNWFKIIKKQYKYENVFITKYDGTVIFPSDHQKNSIDSFTLTNVWNALKLQKTIVTEFHKCKIHNNIIIDCISPVINSDNIIIGSLVLQINPNDFLYPLIQSWPTSSKTAETLIVRKDSDDVLFLNELRHKKNTALNLKISLTRKEIPSVEAVLGKEGIWEGLDYRNVEVLADIKKIPNSNWYMIAKIDKSEIFAELKFRAIIITVLILTLILLFNFVLLWFYHYTQKNIFQNLFFTEKKLHDTEEEFRTILYSIGDGVITTDLTGNIKQMNPVAEKLTGWNEQDAKGISITKVFNIINENTRLVAENPVERVLKEGLIVGLANHTMLISKTGNEIAIADSCAPIINEKSETTGVILVFHDQTFEYLSEKRLRESEQQYRNLFTEMQEGFALQEIICDKDENPIDYRYIDINPSFEKLTGLTKENIIGKTVLEVLPSTEKYWIEEYGKVALTGKPTSFENYSKELIKYFKVVAFSPQKKQFAVIFSDITDRKLAENALTQQQYLMNSLMDNIPDYIYFKDLDSRFLRINKALALSFNLNDPMDAIGKTDFDFFTIEHAQQAFDDEQTIIKNGHPIEKEEKETRENRPDAWVASIKLPLHDIDGEIIGTFGISRDVTNRIKSELLLKEKNDEIETQNEEYKKLNEELKSAKERAEESDRLKTAFLQNLSHEIRTPMNAIMGFSELLVRQYNNKEKLEYYSKIINQRSNDLLKLINDILDIAKIESGQITTYDENFNLKSIFSDLLIFFNEHKVMLRKEHIDFRINMQYDGSEMELISDAVKLKQIFINLIGNAFKFTDKGFIEAGCKTDENQNLIFYVTDTGIGIHKEKQNLIFERFSQLEENPSRIYGGTGLGLSIVKGLVKLLGGEIWIESEPTVGSTFFFTILYKRSALPTSKTQVHTGDAEYDDSVKTILIVEDDQYNAAYLKEIFSDTTYKIIHTEYGKDAVNISITQSIDLVLMDIGLPDIDGYEATRQIKQHKPDLKIIAQTAYAAQSDKQKALSAGCSDYLSKPTKRDVLLSLLNKHLRKK